MGIDRIERQNPWWADPDAIEDDPYIEKFKKSPLKWLPAHYSDISLNEDLIYTLRGPRQVGKTTLLKNLIRRLLREEGISPRRIAYVDCERLGADTAHELVEVLEDYISWIRFIEKDRIYLFIDEATYVRDWERALKILADSGMLRNATVIVTGSHAIDIKRGAERMPGRRGKKTGLDLLLLPMSFREYVLSLHPELKGRLPKLNDYTPKEIKEVVLEASLHSDQIFSLFEHYIRCGGFPISAAEELEKGRVPLYVFDIYRDAVIGDLTRMGRKENLFRDLLIWIFNRRENPFDWSTASRESGIGKHDTVRDYVEDAEYAFVWDIFYKAKGLRTPIRAIRSPRRIYFKDPFIFHALRGWSLGYGDPWSATLNYVMDPFNMGFLVENIVASHLRRVFPLTFYWRNGREIDFLAFRGGQRVLAVEVKYQGRITPENGRYLLKQVGGGIVLSRDTLDLKSDTLLIIPTALFLGVV